MSFTYNKGVRILTGQCYVELISVKVEVLFQSRNSIIRASGIRETHLPSNTQVPGISDIGSVNEAGQPELAERYQAQ